MLKGLHGDGSGGQQLRPGAVALPAKRREEVTKTQEV